MPPDWRLFAEDRVRNLSSRAGSSDRSGRGRRAIETRLPQCTAHSPRKAQTRGRNDGCWRLETVEGEHLR